MDHLAFHGFGDSGCRRCIRRVALLTLAIGVFNANAKAAEESSLVEAKLPADTPFVMAADNLAAACTAWQATQSGQLLSGELFVPIRQAAAKQGVATLLYLRPCFGFDWGDLSSYAGPAAVAVVPIGGGKVGLAWAFPASNQPTDKLFAAGRAYFRDHGYEETTETLGEAKLSVFHPPAKDHASEHPAYLMSKPVAVAAGNRDAAVAIWKQFDGQTKTSLATQKDFSDLASGLSAGEPGPSVRCWVRPLEFWTALRGNPSPPPRPDWLAIARRQGGESIRAMGGRITFPTTGPTDLDLRGRILISEPLTKAAKLLDFSASPPLEIPAWLDDHVASVSLWGCNVPDAVTAFGHLFDELIEPGPKGEGVFQEILAGLRDDPEGPKVDLPRDLFAHLGPGALQATDCRGHNAKDKSKKTRRTLLLLQCRDSNAVAKTLKRFYQGDDEVHESTIDQGKLWTIGEGRSLLFEGSDQSVAAIRAILVSDKTVAFATEPEMLVHQAETRSNASLAESAAYQAVSKWWQTTEKRGPRDMGFVQLAFRIEPSYDAVRARASSDDWAAAMLQLLFTGSLHPSAGFPVEELPAFAKMAPLLPTVVSLREKDAGGWDVRASSLRGPSKKP